MVPLTCERCRELIEANLKQAAMHLCAVEAFKRELKRLENKTKGGLK